MTAANVANAMGVLAHQRTSSIKGYKAGHKIGTNSEGGPLNIILRTCLKAGYTMAGRSLEFNTSSWIHDSKIPKKRISRITKAGTLWGLSPWVKVIWSIIDMKKLDKTSGVVYSEGPRDMEIADPNNPAKVIEGVVMEVSW